MTHCPELLHFRVRISIHTALAGCDLNLAELVAGEWISIHTALAGCDLRKVSRLDSIPLFQSTQPSQAVTLGSGGLQSMGDISIHTALAGCDDVITSLTYLVPLFQSTQPSQAVTNKRPY